ncbi:nitroreductase family protein [Treponema primitia]|uniref:nitroreductase family protein n=1 Tax=Treponema primitia TaxID=88058 RepID=UPI00398017A9
MKKTLFTLALIAALVAPWQSLSAADADTQAIGVITGHYAPRNFAAGSISRADLDRILSAAVRAPSASNRQNWHFTVVQDVNLAKRIVSNITDGNILIIVSAPGDSKTNGAVMLDCGLATQSIYLAAQALGLGSRIYTGPMDALNATLKGELGLPGGYSAAALVRIGRLSPGVDAVSAASSRKSIDSVVSYK